MKMKPTKSEWMTAVATMAMTNAKPVVTIAESCGDLPKGMAMRSDQLAREMLRADA